MQRGSFILVRLVEPKEHYWGRLLEITQAGVFFRGIDVNQIDRFKYQLAKKTAEVAPETLFIPSHRILAISLDETRGSVPSMVENVRLYTALDDDLIIALSVETNG